MYKKNRKTITLLSRMMANILAFVLMLALVPVTVPTLAAYTASDWAKPEIEKAQNYGLIPNALKDADLTKPITRAEFAAIAIKTYENFTGTTVTPVATNPFTDTNDPDVLKAYNINIVNGTTNTTYTPNGILSREQAATMLTRVEKKAYITGWTLATDNSYTLNFTQPAKFADDSSIADYAKTAVYFMNAKGVINGTGNNNFSPAVTATRQEALIIAVRMVEKLKGVTLDYNGGTSEQPMQPTEPTQPPSGETDNKLIGTWSLGSGITRQIRMILSGKYDIRVIPYEGIGTSYTFYDDGTYMSIAAARSHYTGTVVITEGRYSVSNGNIVLINRVAKTTSKSDVPIIWESTVNLPDEIHSYEFGVSELWGWDMLYLDGDRDPGYSRSEDV